MRIATPTYKLIRPKYWDAHSALMRQMAEEFHGRDQQKCWGIPRLWGQGRLGLAGLAGFGGVGRLSTAGSAATQGVGGVGAENQGKVRGGHELWPLLLLL